MTDPAPRRFGVMPPEDLARLTGLEAMRGLLAGRLPAAPMAERLHFRLAEVAEGMAVFEGEPGADILNPLGIVHGGWALTIIDSAAGCAVHTLLPAGVGYTTIETKVNFSRAIRADTGKVRAEGRVVTSGRSIATAEVKMTDTAGRILAHGTSTVMILRDR